MKIFKELIGHSNSKILLISEKGKTFIRKYDISNRNLERYEFLSEFDIKFPKILDKGEGYYDIEYIRNLNISDYLCYNNPSDLLDFIENIIDKFKSTITEQKNYSEFVDTLVIDSNFKFTSDLLREKINEIPIFSSYYFGDFSLDNILYDLESKSFVLIDGLTSIFDSYLFDLHKLKQDLICKWFIRNSVNLHIDRKLKYISDRLMKKYEYYDNNYLTIMMLLRVYPYCKTSFDKKFIIEKANNLWIY